MEKGFGPYKVRSIDGNCPGIVIEEFDDLDEAQSCAEEYAYDFYYGTCIESSDGYFLFGEPREDWENWS